MCKGGLEIFADADPEIDNYQRMDVIMGHFPAGTSMKDVNYWGQMVKKKKIFILHKASLKS